MIGVYLGMVSAWRRGGRFDRFSTGTTLTLYSMPEWWLGLLLIAGLSVGVGPLPGIFPTGGLNSIDADPSSLSGLLDAAWHLTLPVLTLTLAYLAEYSLIMRSSLLDELGEDYLVTARAKGLRDVEVRRRHAVPNALLPTTTLAALNIGFVVSGAITIETIFSIPGLGLLSYEALSIPDYDVLQGTFLLASGAVIAAEPRRQPDLRRARPAGPHMSTARRPRSPPARSPAAGGSRPGAATGSCSAATAPVCRAVILGIVRGDRAGRPLLADGEGLKVTKATGGVLE